MEDSYIKWILALPVAILLSWLHRFVLAKDEVFSTSVRNTLFVIRVVVLTVLIALFLNPLYELNQKKGLPITAAIIVDDSSSMKRHISADSLQVISNKITSEIDAKFQTKKLDLTGGVLGDSLRFLKERTDLISAVSYANNYVSSGGSSLIVLISDGQINDGPKKLINNTLYAPIYTLGLGKELTLKDLSIRNVFHNKVGQVEVDYPIEIEVMCKGAVGRFCEVQISDENGVEIARLKKEIVRDNQLVKFNELLNSDSLGVKTFNVEVRPLSDEQVISNNSRSFAVDFQQKRKRVLLYYDVPHPDVSAFKDVFEKSEKFELINYRQDRSSGVSEDYAALVCFGACPKRVYEQFKDVGKLLFAHDQYDFKNSMNCSLDRFLGEELAQFSFNKGFSDFGLDSSLMVKFSSYPPIEVYLGDYSFSSSASILGRQVINGVKTDFPALMLGEQNDVKEVFFAGNGFYKWSLWEAKNLADENGVFNNDQRPFPYLMEKLLDYTSIKNDNQRFEFAMVNTFLRGEECSGKVRHIDRLGKFIDDSELKVVLSYDTIIQEYPCLLVEDSYVFNVGALKPGRYRLKVMDGKGESSAWNDIVVEDFSSEDLTVSANHENLKNLSRQTDGMYFDINKTDELINHLLQKELKTQSYYEKLVKSLLDEIWLLLLVVALSLSIWTVRKWNGYY